MFLPGETVCPLTSSMPGLTELEERKDALLPGNPHPSQGQSPHPGPSPAASCSRALLMLSSHDWTAVNLVGNSGFVTRAGSRSSAWFVFLSPTSPTARLSWRQVGLKVPKHLKGLSMGPAAQSHKAPFQTHARVTRSSWAGLRTWLPETGELFT